jgi:hypothetical protein
VRDRGDNRAFDPVPRWDCAITERPILQATYHPGACEARVSARLPGRAAFLFHREDGMKIDPQFVRQSIENLKLLYPAIVEDEEAWISALESETNINELFTQVVRRIEDTKALALGTKDRLEELQARKGRFEYRMEALRWLLLKIMESAELKKCELAEATLSIRSGQQQIIGDVDANELHDKFCKISRTIDRTKVKEALKAGQTVPGFELSNAPPSLTIRIK